MALSGTDSIGVPTSASDPERTFSIARSTAPLFLSSALPLLGEDEQRTTRLQPRFEFKLRHYLLCIGNEVGRDIAA